MKTRRWALWIVGAIVAAAAVFFGTRPQPVPAEVSQVTRGPIEVTIDEEGETRVRDRFVVSAPLGGRVLRIELEPGDSVVAGETVLAVFLPSAPVLLDARSRAEAQAAVETALAIVGEAEAHYERAAAELAFSRAEVERYRRLTRDGIVSVEQMETAQLDLDTRQEALEAAEYAVRTALSQLQAARVRLLHSSGQSAAADGGDDRNHITGLRRRAGAVCARASPSSRPARRCSRSATRSSSRWSPTTCRRTRCGSGRGSRSSSIAGVATGRCRDG